MTDWSEIDALPLPEPQPELTDADATGCRYIAGDPRPPRSGMFCGAKTIAGESWCARHRAICYRQVPAKRAA
jgi:hypothetical protein